MFPNDYLNTRQKSQGFGLPVAIFIIVILSMIVASITQLEEASGVAFGQNLNSIRAFYAAESAAEIALARRFPADDVGAQACANNIYVDGSGLEGLNGCSVDVDCSIVTITSGGNYYTFISTASCGSGIDGAQRVIEVRAKDQT